MVSVSSSRASAMPLVPKTCTRQKFGAARTVANWPVAPEAVHRLVLAELPGTRVGVVPDGAVGWPPERFRKAAPSWFAAGFAEAVTVEP